MNLNLHRSVRASYAVLSWIFQYESPVFYRYTQKPLGSVYTKKIEVTHIWIFSGINNNFIPWYKRIQWSTKSMAVFTLEDEQIIWTDKLSDVKTEQTNFLRNKLSDIWLSGKTIFPRQFVC